MLYEHMKRHILTDHPDKNTLTALRYIAKFGWIRAYELGRFMYFDSKNFRERASNLLSRLHKRKLIIERQLPHTAGKAYVLSKGGADYLKNTFEIHTNEYSLIKTGKDIGKLSDGIWLPTNLEHHLLSCSVLAELQAKGADIYSERQIRAHHPSLKKIPDGFAIFNSQGIWVEVENSRKSGKHMTEFASSLASILDHGVAILGIRTRHVLIAYPKFKYDEKHHFINHQLRTTNAIASFLKAERKVTYMPMKLIGRYSSTAIKSIEITLQAEHSHRIAKQIRWKRFKNNSQTANYYGFILKVIALKEAFTYQIHDTKTDTLTESSFEFANVSEAKGALARHLKISIAEHR